MKLHLIKFGVTLVFICLGFFIVNAIMASRPFEYALDIVINGFQPVVEVGTNDSKSFLWSFRQLDIIALAFLMLASVVCCSAIIGGEEAKS